MEEEIQPSAAPPLTTDHNSRKGQDAQPVSGVKKGCLSFATTMLEYFRYTKAFFLGEEDDGEKEAAEVDLQASKMEVEAADAAEDTRKRLEKSC